MPRDKITVNQIQDLYYHQGLSAQETANKLGKCLSQIYKFMRRRHLPRRAVHHTRRIQFLNSPLSYHEKTPLSHEDSLLKTAGLMLYWAEGSKRNKSTVDFANSDSHMAVIFLKMLREIYGVKESRLRIFIYCYSNQNVEDLKNYWSSLLKVPLGQFTQPFVRQDFKREKTGQMPHGLAHIRYSDSRLLSKIKSDIGIISSKISRDGGAVNHTTL